MQHLEHFRGLFDDVPAWSFERVMPGSSREITWSHDALESGTSPMYAPRQVPSHFARALPKSASLPVVIANNIMRTTSPSAAIIMVLMGSPCAFFIASPFTDYLANVEYLNVTFHTCFLGEKTEGSLVL